jgi:hypothetical protein
MLKAPNLRGFFLAAYFRRTFVRCAALLVKSGRVRVWRSAQEVAHLFVENGRGNALQATSFGACRRVRKKLRSGAQLLAHLCLVVWVSVRQIHLFFFLSY